MPISEVKCCDCMDFMAQFPDKFFDLAIVDPPYGLDVANMNMGVGKAPSCPKIEHRIWKPKDWDVGTPPKEYFSELFRVSQNQIIWGGNYFKLPPSRCFLIWDKGEGFYNRSYAEAELAWTSFDANVKIFKRDPLAWGDYRGKIHPTQKPVALYVWLLQNYAKPGDKILDTHMGSQSSRIAAWQMGFDYWGCEIDQEYFDQGCARFEKERRQLNLFAQPDEPEQEALF
jgi:site-specific DNA-methyltransferase (adenine-specific)